jgi:hypothetical protein
VTFAYQSSAEKFLVGMQAGRDVNKKIKSLITVAGLVLAVCAYVALAAPAASAATLRTSNLGTDSSTCGASASPCRSISQAIVNASDGDTIWVGPGHYGDVNGDGNFTGPGDEQPDPNGGEENLPSGPFGCIVCITKALHIYSTDGAALTFIEANASTGSNSTVMILRDGGDFGAPDHGFTITGGNTYGVTIAPYYGGSTYSVSQNMTIKGNVDIGDGEGFYIQGLGWKQICPSPFCQFTARILVASNRAINNTTGFDVSPNYWAGRAGQFVVRDNEALGDVTGFRVFPGIQDYPFQDFAARNVQLINNIAAHGGTGFYADVPGLVSYNTALDNSQSGFTVTPGGASFNFNAAISNGGPGIIVNLSNSGPGVILDPADVFSTFSGNNFFGNDRRRTQLFPGLGLYLSAWNPGPSAHCGVLNLGPMAAIYGPAGTSPVPATQLQAANNYWGSSKGPSSSGPGDNAGGVCDQNNSTTITKPFSPTISGSTVTPVVLEN